MDGGDDPVADTSQDAKELNMSKLNIWSKGDVLDLIESNDVAAMRGVCALFRRQTEDEKTHDDAKHLNGRGFSATTAKAGSELAKWMTRGELDGKMRRSVGGAMQFGNWADSGRRVWRKRINVCKEICRTHASQLAEIANEGRA